jgi:hypothetical protein
VNILVENILDEITRTIKVLTGRADLKVNGAYDEDKNKILSVQINASKMPIPEDDLVVIRELYGLRIHEVRDNRRYGPKRLDKCIKYLIGISKVKLSLL